MDNLGDPESLRTSTLRGIAAAPRGLSFPRQQSYATYLSNKHSKVEVTEMTLTREGITVWTDDRGAPKRIVVGNSRYRVSDTPTVLESGYDLAATHPAGVGDC